MKRTLVIIGICIMLFLSSGCSLSDHIREEMSGLDQPSPTKEDVYSEEPVYDEDNDSSNVDDQEQETDAEFREKINQINLGVDPQSGTYEIGISLDELRVFPAHTEWDNPSSIPVVAVYYSVYNFSGQPVNPLTELEEHIKINFNREDLTSTQSMDVINFESGAEEMLPSDSSGMYATLFMMPYFSEESLAKKDLYVEFVADDGSILEIQKYSIDDLLSD